MPYASSDAEQGREPVRVEAEGARKMRNGEMRSGAGGAGRDREGGSRGRSSIIRREIGELSLAGRDSQQSTLGPRAVELETVAFFHKAGRVYKTVGRLIFGSGQHTRRRNSAGPCIQLLLEGFYYALFPSRSVHEAPHFPQRASGPPEEHLIRLLKLLT